MCSLLCTEILWIFEYDTLIFAIVWTSVDLVFLHRSCFYWSRVIFIAAANWVAKGNEVQIILPEKCLLVCGGHGRAALALAAVLSRAAAVCHRWGGGCCPSANEIKMCLVMFSSPFLSLVQWLSNWLPKSEGFFCPVSFILGHIKYSERVALENSTFGCF